MLFDSHLLLINRLFKHLGPLNKDRSESLVVWSQTVNTSRQLARYDPNLREMDLCELNRPTLIRAEVIPASLAPIKSVVPDTLTNPQKYITQRELGVCRDSGHTR